MAPRREPVFWAVAAILALSAQCSAETTAKPVAESTGQSSDTPSTSVPQSSADIVQAALARGCASTYTITCFKLDALSVLGRMAVPATYDLLPGVTIRRSVSDLNSSAAGVHLPPDLVQSLAADTPQEMDKRLDEFLMSRFGNFLDSHTVQVRLLDLQPVANLKKALSSGQEDATGRKRNGMWQQLMGAGMMMGGSTLTMGLSALAAMAGKALMLSMLSLVLSAMSGLGGGGGGGHGHSQKQTTYEIISKPIYTHGHSHSAELHHDTSGPAAYGLYGRSKETESVSGSGTSGVGGSGVGGSPATTSYISQYPRSLQEGAEVSHHRLKKPEDEKTTAASQSASSYDNLLIRNLQYVKGEDGRAKYSVAAPVDLIPSESDYGADATPEDSVARSFQVGAGEDEGLAGVFDATSVVAGPRSMHTFARVAEGNAPRTHILHGFRGSPPDFTRSAWEAITPAPSVQTTSTSNTRAHVDPPFVVAKPVAPSSSSSPSSGPSSSPSSSSSSNPSSSAYRAYS